MPAPEPLEERLLALSKNIDGELYWDDAMNAIYATDASVYRTLPIAVCLPRTNEDLVKLVHFANEAALPIIPRTAGTSLAGQVVGKGIVVDVSKHMVDILELNVAESWVRVQPGVVRDELNLYLKPHGLMFAPETSTSNRCMIGGMVGNNSCGTRSLVYGSTRDHVLEIEAILSDGSQATFGPVSPQDFDAKKKGRNLEGEIYRALEEALSDPRNREAIEKEYPHHGIHRRNTGYALDLLLRDLVNSIQMKDTANKGDCRQYFNLSKLLCGSEGTLALFTSLKLNLEPLPPPEKAVVAVHLDSIQEAAKATLIAREFAPQAIELIDKVILDCSKTNIEQSSNRDFVSGDPGALLVVEFVADSPSEIDSVTESLESALRASRLGSDFPVIRNEHVDKVWALRNAGLGVLTNVRGSRKPIAGVEDTAILPVDLPEYVDAFLEIMNRRKVKCVAYAHIGDGEIHFRPMLDLKLGTDRKLYREIADEVADLVKLFGGSLSGEHGDGRARAEYLEKMIGSTCYQLCREVKQRFDPKGILNPGKIVDAPPIDTELRYDENQAVLRPDTLFDFSSSDGILGMAEKCNGTGACRKTEKIGGVMCPSYMATRNEKDTTRARANILREYLTRSTKRNRFQQAEIGEVMGLCLSCKGCLSECPSNVDVSRLKAEYLYQSNKGEQRPLSQRAIGHIAELLRLGSRFPTLSNWALHSKFISKWIKSRLEIAPKRELPSLSKPGLRKWTKRNLKKLNTAIDAPKKSVYLFADEYTSYTDAHIGIQAIQLLTGLGYPVAIPQHRESGRALISSGFLDKAKTVADANVVALAPLINEQAPLLGIEPSAILGFRDEYPDLVEKSLSEKARDLGKHVFTIEEFLYREMRAGQITASDFNDESKHILYHGHCHQKALSNQSMAQAILELPTNFEAQIIDSGCCGMAGFFGYRKERYELSQSIAELVLFPAIREAPAETTVAASGTSCRQQIKDGLRVEALHPVEILAKALKRDSG